MVQKVIRNVAIYLRKSRGDSEEDILSKHRLKLIEYAQSKKWRYTIYEEDIISGELIINRPQIQLLLDDILDKKFDGILVMAYDRLSRGDQKEFGIIIETMRDGDCPNLITPQSIYNIFNDNDSMVLGIQGVFARTEHRAIINRLIEGKRMGAKQGRWTNGKPPFPYKYKKHVVVKLNGQEEIRSEVIVDEEKREVYNKLKNMYLTGKYGIEKIAIELNKEGYKSPGGTNWYSNAIKRLLIHEFHMGHSIYGKNEWRKDRFNNRKIYRIRDKDEWNIGTGNWEILKTEEEHEEINRIMQKNNKIPSRSKQGVYPTSGLMYCQKCGFTMKYSVGRVELKTGNQYNYTKCNHVNPIGERCSQHGLKLTPDFYESLYNAIIVDYLNSDMIKSTKLNQMDTSIKQEMTRLKLNAKVNEEKLSLLKNAYLQKVIPLNEYHKDRVIIKLEQDTLENSYTQLQDKLLKMTSLSNKELEKRIKIFQKQWKQCLTDKERNDLLKTVVRKITYNRDEENVTLVIDYL